MVVGVLRKDGHVALAVDLEDAVADGAVAEVAQMRSDDVGGRHEEVLDGGGGGGGGHFEDEVGARVGDAPEHCVGALARGQGRGGGRVGVEG